MAQKQQKKSGRPWQIKIAALVRGGLKNANDAHPELNNYNGRFSSVEKRLTNNIIAFVERTLEEHGIEVAVSELSTEVVD